MVLKGYGLEKKNRLGTQVSAECFVILRAAGGERGLSRMGYELAQCLMEEEEERPGGEAGFTSGRKGTLGIEGGEG